MNRIGGLIGGTVAGAVGAAVWAGIAYGTGYEIGWIAWGIGLLVGIGVLVGGREGGAQAGVLAVILAVLSILAGKYAAVHFAVQKELKGAGAADLRMQIANDLRTDEEWVISFIADAVIEERAAAGETIAWPGGAPPTEPPDEQHEYDPGIWSDAAARWDGMSPPEQESYRASLVDFIATNVETNAGEIGNAIAQEGFMHSFGLFDVVFFGLAIVTAFKVGSGGGDE